MSSLKQSPDRNGYLNLLILAGVDGEVGGRVDGAHRASSGDGIGMRHGDGVAALEAVEVVDEVADPAHLALPLVVVPTSSESRERRDLECSVTYS